MSFFEFVVKGTATTETAPMQPDRLKTVISTNVRRLRDKRGMTQEQLAEAIEKSPEAISMFERGRTTPALETLALIATALGCSLMDMLSEDALPLSDHRADLLRQAEVSLAGFSDDQLEMAVKLLAVLREGLGRG
ncbi:MAG: helix-turn-helix transcriptional regulator [Magnetospirillum sp.]|nr:helix-turn-helix transcriptional regulator [Magnetospirillum sp.]